MPSTDATVPQRFWAKVSKTDGGCWEWTGSTRGGYGALGTGSGVRDTHRISWELHHGAIPDGMCVCHTCDNRSCVNPAHLFLGSKRANALDAAAKQRIGRHGKQNSAPEVRAEVLRLCRIGVPFRQIATQFGLSPNGISQLNSRNNQPGPHSRWNPPQLQLAS